MRTSLFTKSLIGAVLMLAAAQASSVVLFSGGLTADIANPAPAGVLVAPGPLGPVGGIGGPVMVDTGPAPMGIVWSLQISVQDCCLVGDIYEVQLDGAFIGLTSVVPIGGPTLSSGVFTSGAVSAGMHSVDIWDPILSYIGSPSPAGGGIVPAIYSPAGLSLTVEAFHVPEPAALGLLGIGLLGMGMAFRHRRNARSA